MSEILPEAESVRHDEHKSKDKKKIKQAPSAFVLFCKDMRKQICIHCPYFSPPDVSKVLSERWKALSPAEKNRYREKAAELAFYSNENEFGSSYEINNKKQVVLPSISSLTFPSIKLQSDSDNHFASIVQSPSYISCLSFRPLEC